MSYTLSLDSTPAGLAANLFAQVYGQYIQNLQLAQADKVRPPRPGNTASLFSTDKIGFLFACSSA